MIAYIAKLLLTLPLIAALVWATLWCWQRAQKLVLPGMARDAQGTARLRLVEVISIGAQTRLALVEVDGHATLIGISRAGIAPITVATGADAQP